MEGSDEEFLGQAEQQAGQQAGQQGQQVEQFDDQDYSEEYTDDLDEFEEDYLGEGIPDLTGSEPKPMGGIYSLFHTVLKKPDSTKVSNLNKVELGDIGISVRGCQKIALLGNTFHHPIFAKFFEKQAGIISDSAMSKEGWFTELFVTSKKYASRASSSDTNALPQFNKGKWKMFSGKNKTN